MDTIREKTLAKTGIVIQARMGSQRLPGKVALPFSGKEPMLSVILERLARLKVPSLVATSGLKEDDVIEGICNELGIQVFRGHSADVLNRFVEASHLAGFKHVVRVCADSPFLSPRLLEKLLEAGASNSTEDYLGFTWKGKPAILSHLGVFAEWVKVEALEQAANATDNPFYHEHVTNYIYLNPEAFKLKWLDLPNDFNPPPNCRLTVDTPEDFSTCQSIYHELEKDGYDLPDYPDVFAYLLRNPSIASQMENQIKLNTK